MQHLNWSGTFLSIDSWADVGSPGDPPIHTMAGEVHGINNTDTWGDGADFYTIFGTPDADLIFLDKLDHETPRLINITVISTEGGNDLIDMTSTRFMYGAVTLNGGTGDDWLLANSGADILVGHSGSDQLKGYGGNDHLDGGTDNDHLYGGRGNDKLIGGSGSDYLSGQFGKDTMTGGKGKDAFVFDTKPNKKTNLDKIVDYNVKDDSVYLDNAVFEKLGGKGSEFAPAKLSKAFFKVGDSAKDRNDYVVYDNKKGILYYDADGSGGGKAVEIATLKKNLKMTSLDVFVI